MNNEKIKIIDASWDDKKHLAKVKIQKLETTKEEIWALTGESFDSLISQITGRNLQYHTEQRKTLCLKIIGLEFINTIEIDIDNTDVDSVKDKNVSDLQNYHNTMDMYPFYEIQQEVIEESRKKE